MPDNNTTQPEKRSPKVEDIFDFDDQEQPPLPERKEQAPEMVSETIPETPTELKPEEKSKEEEQAQRQYVPPAASEQKEPPPAKSEEIIKIENILSDHLDELYLQMTPQQQMVFKQKGEETAAKVHQLLQETKVKIKEIFQLIKEWLKLIPGINKFFLEQEAKIKTDRLLNLREQKQKQK